MKINKRWFYAELEKYKMLEVKINKKGNVIIRNVMAPSSLPIGVGVAKINFDTEDMPLYTKEEGWRSPMLSEIAEVKKDDMILFTRGD